ncbi:MAG: hypothetical protein H5U20_08415 [Rhodobacteraceae bacterium]|nr:hypothetical protein [Paracoccaceae bacterium]
MLRLGLTREPRWLDLARGVRVKVRPYSTVVKMMAQTDSDLRAVASGDAADDDPGALARLSMASSVAIARAAILEWEGVGDEDGTPVPPTPEWVARLMDEDDIHEAFNLAYLAPAMRVEQEKNGFAPLPNGTSAGAPTTAAPAKARAQSARRH